MNFKDLFKMNDFAPQFMNARDKEEVINRFLVKRNSQGFSKEQLDIYNNANYLGYFADVDAAYCDFSPIIETKRTRIAKYREMSLYPEIMDALESIVNDAIVDNGDDQTIIELNMKRKNIPSALKKRIRALYEYWVEDILKFKEKGYKYFKRWLIEGEIYAELITNETGDNIVGIKVLPAFTCTPVYNNGEIAGFVQVADVYYRTMLKNQNGTITFEPNQIAYANYDAYGENELDTRGYLESAVRTYNMLKSLEDSIVIYRLVRAPERRLWSIYTGRTPKGKAEEYMKQLIKKYRTKVTFDPNTGTIDSTQNVQSLSHDIWISYDENGNGHKVDTIGGGMQLGEIGDLDWFLNKLYKALRLPTSRWMTDQKQTPYSAGKMGEVVKEEIKFARFIEELQRKFKYFVLTPFLTLLRMRGIPEDYLNPLDYDIKFVKSNLFKEYKEIELMEARLGILSTVSPFIVSRDNVNSSEALFSKEFALKKYFKMTDELYDENKKLVEKELEEAQDKAIKFPPINPYDPTGEGGLEDPNAPNQGQNV